MATHSSIRAWRIPMDRGAWRGYSPFSECVCVCFNLSKFFSFSRAVSKSGLPARPSLSLQHIILRGCFCKNNTFRRALSAPRPTPAVDIWTFHQDVVNAPGEGFWLQRRVDKSDKGCKISSQLSADTTGFRLSSALPAFSRPSYITSPGRAGTQLSAQRRRAECKPPR